MADGATPLRMPDGKWRVGERIFETNAEAWRYADRLEGEPVSKREDTGDWSWNRSVHGE